MRWLVGVGIAQVFETGGQQRDRRDAAAANLEAHQLTLIETQRAGQADAGWIYASSCTWKAYSGRRTTPAH